MSRCIADRIFERYLALRDSRAGLQSQNLSRTEGYRSSCCGAPMTSYRGENICTQCRQKRGVTEIRAARAGGSNNSWKQIHIQETQTRDVHREQRRLAGQTSPWLLAQELIEPLPLEHDEVSWRFSLEAWELAVHPRVQCSRESETLQAVVTLATVWRASPWWNLEAVTTAIGDARKTVRWRASSRRSDVRQKLGIVLDAGKRSDGKENASESAA